MKILNLQLRFLLPQVIILVSAAWLALPLLDQLTLRWFERDLDIRGELVTNALSDSICEATSGGTDGARGARPQALFDRAVQDERLFAIGLCSLDGELLRHAASYPPTLRCADAKAASMQREPRLGLAGGPVHLGFHTVNAGSGPVASLVVPHGLSFAGNHSQDTRRHLIVFITGLGLAIALITMVVAQLSWRGWVAGVRGILRGEGIVRPMLASPEILPFAADLRVRLRDLEDDYRRSQGPAGRMGPGAAACAAAHAAARRPGDCRVEP